MLENTSAVCPFPWKAIPRHAKQHSCIQQQTLCYTPTALASDGELCTAIRGFTCKRIQRVGLVVVHLVDRSHKLRPKPGCCFAGAQIFLYTHRNDADMTCTLQLPKGAVPIDEMGSPLQNLSLYLAMLAETPVTSHLDVLPTAQANMSHDNQYHTMHCSCTATQ